MSGLKNLPQQHLCALISMACPLIAVGLLWAALSDHEEFWNRVSNDLNDEANHTAMAMMGVGEGIQAMIYLTVGAVAGCFFAIVSLLLRRSRLGIISLVLNLAPFLFFLGSTLFVG
jgi:hypothetical protein